jgi:tetratricopeptide (TPR) repeat protein
MNIQVNIERALQCYYRANELFKQGSLDDAVAEYKNSLNFYPEHFECLFNLGLTLQKLKRLDEARENLEKALEISPDSAETLFNLGLNRQLAGRNAASLPYYLEILKKTPDRLDVMINLASAFANLKKYDEAETYFLKIQELAPSDLVSLFNLGCSFLQKGNISKAKETFISVLEKAPEHYNAMRNMAHIYIEFEKNTLKAKELYEKIPENKRDFNDYYNLGNVYKNLFENRKAEEFYKIALKLNPDHPSVHWNLALALLQNGDIYNGFQEYIWRWKIKKTTKINILKPLWNGQTDKNLRLLIHSEQGYGDNLQFIRYLPVIRDMVGEIIFSCDNNLFRLFSGQKYIDKVIKEEEVLLHVDEFDVWSPLLDMPTILKTDENTMPHDMPYIYPEQNIVNLYNPLFEKYKDSFRIGFIWKTNPKSDYSIEKSCAIDDFKVLFDVDKNINFFSLQREEHSLPSYYKCINLAKAIDSFAHTAGLLMHLDLIITVDTALAHLSGAMGKPTWTILPYNHDWRWGVEGKKSPWYPEMKLFRMEKKDDWKGVFLRIKQELEKI